MKHLRCVAVLLLAAALPASAQKTRRVSVAPPVCNAGKQPIYVILNGNDNNAFEITSEGKYWVGEWTGAKPLERFRIKGSFASLRYGRTRTNCAPAQKDDDPKFDDPWAWFKFSCSIDETRDVELSPSPAGVRLGFVRTLTRQSDCREWGMYEGLIQNVRVSGESLMVRVQPQQSDDQAPAVLVNFASAKPITLDDILAKFAVSRAKGNAGPDAVTPNAIEIDRARLKGSGLTGLTVTPK
jgi:hypothetical protein